MSRVVIRVVGVIVGLDKLQPAQQYFLISAEKRDDSKPF